MPKTRQHESLPILLREVRSCGTCAEVLPLGPRPVVQAGASARLLIIGQAPGTKVHASGIPWDDVSGDRLRNWLGLTPEVFYDPAKVAIMPMGFCYPGKGANGDLPPRKECAQLWHAHLLALMPDISLTLLVGQYAQAHYIKEGKQDNLTATVQAWLKLATMPVSVQETMPVTNASALTSAVIPLPHPSPRNRSWFAHNPWFESRLLPLLRQRVAELGLVA